MTHNFTLRLEYATSALICSSARAVRKHDAADTKAMRPPLTSPAATPTMSCSAMPTLINRSGKAFLNASSLLEPTESLTTPTMRWFSCASSARVSTYALRQSYRGRSAIDWEAEAREAAAGSRGVVPPCCKRVSVMPNLLGDRLRQAHRAPGLAVLR